MNDQEYAFLQEKIYKLTDLDIGCYKSQQMRRRLDAYILKNKYPSIAAYCSTLEKNPALRRELLDYLAINVSEFLRDSAHFQTLKNTILPQLLSMNRRLNIWSAACSCGQEPYSVSMILEEIRPGFHRILATDIDESALTQAKNGGPYTTYDVRNIEKSLLEKYFTQDKSGFWVKDILKKNIVFKRHNLLKELFEQNFDLIICRNVIIYFSEIVRDELYRKFYDSLKIGGVLFLGGSEVVLKPAQQGFFMIRPSFYRKMGNSTEVPRPSHDLSEVMR